MRPLRVCSPVLLETGETLLQRLRRERGLTQMEAACGIGIAAAHVSYVERGCKMPGIGLGLKLADFYGVDVRFLARFMGWMDQGEPSCDVIAESYQGGLHKVGG